MLTFEQIKELIRLVRDGQLQGLELEERSGQRIKITGRNALPEGAQIVNSTASGAAPRPPQPEVIPALGEGEEAPSEEPEAEQERPEDAHVVTSPIVGTFYAAPGPDSDPYVGVGDRIHEGQVLCIVEAMKLMNEIESDVGGTVLEILPKNAQPVEYGEELFVIELD